MHTAWVMVSPMYDATLFVPFVHTLKLDLASRGQCRNSGRYVDVVRNEHRVPGAEAHNEALVPGRLFIVGKGLFDHASLSNGCTA